MRRIALAIAIVALPFSPVSAFAADIIQQIIQVESRGNAKARGRAGEYGLMQIKCQTARGVGFKGACGQLFDPTTNVRYGTAYFRQALAKAKGNVCHALTLYNRGIGARPQNSAYCRKVLGANPVPSRTSIMMQPRKQGESSNFFELLFGIR